MTEQLVLWTHTLAALLLAAVAWWAARRPLAEVPRTLLVALLAIASVWALAVAGLGGNDPATRLLAGLRDLTIMVGMATIHRGAATRTTGLLPVYGVVGAVVAIGTVLQLLAIALTGYPAAAPVEVAVALLRMLVATAALVLLHALWLARAQGALRLLCGGLACLWAGDLVLATSAYVTGHWSPGMMALRGTLAMLSAGFIAMAIQRDEQRPVTVSRTVAYQSLSLVAVGAYLALLAIGTSAIAAFVPVEPRIYQTAFVFGATTAVLTLVSSTWLRGWLKVTIAKHLFRHRYDYRTEWLRFTGTLGTPEAAAPLAERIVKAIADLTASPRGLLLVPDGDGLATGAGWNWFGESGGAGAAFVRCLEVERIVALDELRAGTAPASELGAAPQWMIDDADVWAVVPMIHLGRLVGAVVLARPTVDRALDWEDFDLLRVAGRQVASYLAEARAQDALAEGRRFDEFNRRFAFIVHDIKNVVSGLALVARNAERHADNPEFRADMVATLQDSAARLNTLLGRLSAGPRGRGDPPVAVPLLDLARRLAGRRRAGHPVVVTGDEQVVALADPARLEQVLDHLVTNAAEASEPGDAVVIDVSATRGDAIVAVIDRGRGMSPAFVRDELFRPFASSKPGGFGIGAFEARQLAEGMGARILVDSREGLGTTFTIHLPSAHQPALEAAA